MGENMRKFYRTGFGAILRSSKTFAITYERTYVSSDKNVA